MDERAPKYYILKKTLEERIENEEFPADQPIPSERELMETYQVAGSPSEKQLMNW